MQSFPVSFVRAQAANFGELATFQLSNCDQAWPIELTNTDPDPSGESLKIFAFGPGGWKDFVVANGIQVRDTLVFALVAQSLFRVHILKADSAEDHEEEDPSRDPSSFPLPCKRCRNVPSQNSGPRFVVNVTRSTQVNKLVSECTDVIGKLKLGNLETSYNCTFTWEATYGACDSAYLH